MTDTRTPREDLLRSQSAAATRVFMTLLTRGPASRVDIARLTGLSAAAVTKAVTPLLAVELVREQSDAPSTGHPGRPATLIAVVPDSLITFGVKVNHDELIAVATDLTTQVLATSHLRLNRHDVASTADAIAAVCAQLTARLGDTSRRLASVGVAVSGDVDSATGEVRASALMGWMGAPLGTLLAERLPVPVVVENDVRALTIGEHLFGAGVGKDTFAIVTLGRGIGSGIYTNGDVVSGAFGVAGEIGHLPLASPDRICPCGRRGCVEAVAATPAIAQTISTALKRPVSAEEAIVLLKQRDPVATLAWADAATVIGSALACLVNLVGPQTIIVGGEAATAFDTLNDTIRASFHTHAFGAAARCEFVVTSHTFEDWARGAAAASIRSFVL